MKKGRRSARAVNVAFEEASRLQSSSDETQLTDMKEEFKGCLSERLSVCTYMHGSFFTSLQVSYH